MFLIAAALAMATPPDRWVGVGGSTDVPEEYVDKHSISRNGNKVTVWTRSDFASDQGTAWKEMEFDCSARMHAILAYVRNDRGTISHNVTRPHQATSPVRPASVEEKVLDMVCR